MNQLDKFSHMCRGTSAVDAELSAKNSLFREISRGEITTSGETQKENVSFLLSGRVKKKRKKKWNSGTNWDCRRGDERIK